MNKRINELAPIVYWIIGLFLFFFFPKPSVFAVGEFQADYDVQYAISPTGTTIVTQNVTLTNKMTNLYAQKYTIVIDSTNIKNVIAFDNKGIVTPTISQKDGKTQIVLAFNDKVVGQGGKLPFSLRYEDADIAKQNGGIWEVNVPGVASDPDMGTYSVTLRVPPTFGQNAYMTPLPSTAGRWTKEQMVQGGISAAYGTTQAFTTTLSYFLENQTVSMRQQEIALPPDTAFQHVFVDSLSPKPKTVVRDDDGNWLARYQLLPMQQLSIAAKVTMVITLKPRDGYTEPLTNASDYTKPLKYWEANNPQIQALAKQYTTPRAIYDYVVGALSYDYKRVSAGPVRKGAVAALTDPKSSICMEFTDLFVAIARAAGIPARENVGYAYTTNSKLRPLSLVADVLHAWPEYYDSTQSVWVPIDPTWASTTGGVNYFDKLDFNHIVFAIQGISSDYPYPAGFYRKAGKTTKDVEVSFADTIPKFTGGTVDARIAFPSSVTSGFTAQGNIIVENSTGEAVQGTSVTVNTTPVDLSIAKTFPILPPFANEEIPIAIPLPSYFMKGTGSIVMTLNGNVKTFPFEIHPLIYQYVVPLLIGSFVFFILAWIVVRLPTLWKHHKKQ